MRFSFLFSFTFFLSAVFTQIDKQQLKRNIEILASDSLEGRNTGDLGQKKAAVFIQNHFRSLGLDSLTEGYFQTFLLAKNQTEGELKINKQKLFFPTDFAALGDVQLMELKSSGVPCYNYGDFTRLKIKDISTVIIRAESITKIDLEFIKNSGIKNVFVLLATYDASYFAKNKGKVALFVKREQHVFFVNENKLKNQLKNKNKLTLRFKSEEKCKYSENIVALIPGSDPELKKEYIVISAHYDHLGVKKGIVYNGADDNASGTACLMELARYFKEQQKKGNNPKRSLLFICFSGEEHGLLGSKFYTDNPLIPLKQTVADFNIDMIGRTDSIKEKDKYLVYAIGSDKISLDFHQKHEKVANEISSLVLDYTYNEDKHPDKLYYRSDHYNFAKNGIPSVFYFGGFHKDYHQPTDDADKIDVNKVSVITELVIAELLFFGN